VWKVLDAMIADFRERGGIIQPKPMVELRSAKTLISVLLVDQNCVGVRQRIEEYLFNVESYIMAEGQMMLGIEYVDNWSSRLDQASKKPVDEGEETRSALSKQDLPSGLPRRPDWVRISSLPEFQIDELKELADAFHLSCILQNNGILLVSGENDELRKFIKNVASIKTQNKAT
jgi:hypothetical protein